VKKEHILVIRFSAMGDVAMTVPVIYSVAKAYPDVHITMLSRPFARPFFENLAPNVSFMAADVKKEYHGLRGLNRLYRRLVAKQPTAVADLHSVLRSDYLRMRFNLGGYNVEHINKHRKDRRRLVADEGKKRLKQLKTPFENYLNVFERLGYPIEKMTFKAIEPGECDPTIELGHPTIGIAPFAAHEGKIYPIDRMRRVVELLAEQHPDARFFLFGRGKNEEKVFSEWTTAMDRCVNVSRLCPTMQKELQLIRRMDVMVSMDSANMHLASLTGVPVVSIWGATHPMAGFMGYGQKESNAIQLDLPCRPCSIYGKKPCKFGDYRCLQGITPESITEKVNLILTKNN
jgi:ADP-heptose:LPS heptosyltransferase